METPVYDVNYFIAKFSAIPEDKWCTDMYKDGDKYCAYGHCGRGIFDMTVEAKHLSDLFEEIRTPVARINDGDPGNRIYRQSTPKQRILAALYDIKKLQEQEQQPKYIDLTKELAQSEIGRLITEAPDKILIPETIKN